MMIFIGGNFTIKEGQRKETKTYAPYTRILKNLLYFNITHIHPKGKGELQYSTRRGTRKFIRNL